jgi:hypothetical protein
LAGGGLDRADYLLTVARLWVLYRLFPLEETPVDRAIREEGERLRKAFPAIDFAKIGANRHLISVEIGR